MKSYTCFRNQPAAYRLGIGIGQEFAQPHWQVVEMAVAWVRRSGSQHLLPHLVRFLKRGGVLRITVGIDIENTSEEGLQDLLLLRQHGSVDLFVHHNEESGVTFHPKVYLFYGRESAKLIVGSNNLTESGLYINTEASVELQVPPDDDVIQDALRALASWREPSEKLALPLTQDLLADLVQEGYVLSEKVIRRRRVTAEKAQERKAKGKTLFGRNHITRPQRPRLSSRQRRDKARSQSIGRVLLMRVRKASETDRPTQTQVPKELFEDPFFSGVKSITSAHDGRSHGIHRARARGIVNTLKLEIPEMRDFAEPVVRLQRVASSIVYAAYDAQSVLGQPVFAALNRGRRMSPPATKMTKPASPKISTWWRFI